MYFGIYGIWVRRMGLGSNSFAFFLYISLGNIQL